MIQWPPSLADILAALTAAGAVGSAIMVAVHGHFARARAFKKINSIQRRVAILWELAPLEEKLKRATLTGFEDEDDD